MDHTDHTQCDHIHNVYHQYSPNKWSMHRVIKYTKFMSILSTRENHTQAAVHPSLTELVSVCCPSPPSLGWNQACLPLGWYQACLARSRESKSGVQISLWDTCPNTLRSPPPPLSGWMDTTSWKTTKHKTFRSHCHTISHLKQLYHFTSAYTTSHVAIQDTLRALLDNHSNIEEGFLLGHKIKIIVKLAVESWSIFNSLLLVLKNYRGTNVILHNT